MFFCRTKDDEQMNISGVNFPTSTLFFVFKINFEANLI